MFSHIILRSNSRHKNINYDWLSLCIGIMDVEDGHAEYVLYKHPTC